MTRKDPLSHITLNYVLVKIITEVVVHVNEFHGLADTLTIAGQEHFFFQISPILWRDSGQATSERGNVVAFNHSILSAAGK